MEFLTDSIVLFSALAWPESLAWVKNFAMVAIGLGFVIFVHELGHFLVAKACGVKCEKFYIGFDVPIPLGFFSIPGKLVHFQWGETEYGIGAIPLGGYVKMLGQDDNPNNAETESERTELRDGTGSVRLDPRSYPAKSVPKRLAIISAGVIMNIIFGFLFASIAYRNGVMIQPAVVGSTSPGDPAWKLGLPVGTRILQLGKDGTPNEHMRFSKDMMLNLALYGRKYFETDMDLKVRYPDGKEEWISLRPSDRFKESKEISRPSIGIAPSRSIEFGSVPRELLPLIGSDFYDIVAKQGDKAIAVDDFADVQKLMALDASVTFELKSKVGDDDKLIAIEGQPVKQYADVERLLARNPGKAIEITVEHTPQQEATNADSSPTDPQRYTLTLSPRPVLDYGIETEVSAITAVQKGSPAEKAGILPGDRLVSFDGEPVGDLLTFPQRTLAHVGETVQVEVERAGTEATTSKQHKLRVTLREPQQTMWSSMNTGAAVETMGIAYNISSKVATVRADGPAAGKLEPGDQIVKVQFQTAGAPQHGVESALHRRPEEVIELDGKMRGWPSVLYEASTQRMPDSTLIVTALRGEKELIAELIGTPSTENFIDHHGLALALTGLEEKHVAESWSDAFRLGAREMKERMTEVITVVGSLATGRISLFQMGGPISIFTMAGREADRGITDLLMFFAFLSANLAVLNFLPIPALDGGHALFLMYEWIRRKPVDENLQMKLSAAGILSLLALMVFVTILDVQKLFW